MTHRFPLHETCEWDPDSDSPAMSGAAGCRNRAVVSVKHGKAGFHLCDNCADLPRFSGGKQKPLRTDVAK